MKKILFNDKHGLTKAVLDGRKTQTRRVAFKDADEVYFYDFGIDSKGRVYACFPRYDGEWQHLIYPHYQPGEVVAVAQSYRDIFGKEYLPIPAENEIIKFITDDVAGVSNKMFVQSDLMPHRIEITNIRVERLQDISEEDCLKEGVYYHTEPPKHHEYDRYSPWGPSVKPYKFESEKYFCSAKYAFKHLIEKVSDKGTWERNPWVFVYDFKLVER